MKRIQSGPFLAVLLFLFAAQTSFSLGIYGKDYFRPSHTILIENEAGGRVMAVKNKSTTWEILGKVIYPCQQINPRGYTASKWAKPSAVAATAVNAIHIKTGDNTQEAKGVVFSVVPLEMLNPPSYYNSFLSPDSSIYTDIKAGNSIFGGVYSAFVGNPVFFERGTAEALLLNEDYVPKLGDRIIINVLKPFIYPRAIIFENREGGAAKVIFGAGQEEIIGEVQKPVEGVGRFQGTQYVSPGRIRANHTGVIDVSTSPINKIGGFQIIPSAHALSDEMEKASKQTQWMVIGPVPGREEFLEGMPPLFSNYLRPVYLDLDLDSKSWMNDLLARFLVDVKLKGSDKWQPMPIFYIDPDLRKPLPEWTVDAIADVTHIRILFPVDRN
ncbi:MAG: hypothetical protein WC527_01250 [Candidatus Margulisiibacteriota bacterium]